jgi:hypothetical protein
MVGSRPTRSADMRRPVGAETHPDRASASLGSDNQHTSHPDGWRVGTKRRSDPVSIDDAGIGPLWALDPLDLWITEVGH